MLLGLPVGLVQHGDRSLHWSHGASSARCLSVKFGFTFATSFVKEKASFPQPGKSVLLTHSLGPQAAWSVTEPQS